MTREGPHARLRSEDPAPVHTTPRPARSAGPRAAAALWLCAALLGTAGLPQAARGPREPIRNLRMDVAHKRLVWDVTGNVSRVICRKETTSTKHATRADYRGFCEYTVLSLCSVTNYTVSAAEPSFSTWIRFPEPDPYEAAAAAMLGCDLHGRAFMNCSWAVGRRAPGDVQYRLVLTNDRWVSPPPASPPDSQSCRLTRPRGSPHSTQHEHPCPHYETDGRGVHVGCRFPNVTALPHIFTVTVHGTSRVHPVPCTDLSSDLREIEVLGAPNVTARCNTTHVTLEWAEPPSLFPHEFQYELRVEKSEDPGYGEPRGVPPSERPGAPGSQVPTPRRPGAHPGSPSRPPQQETVRARWYHLHGAGPIRVAVRARVDGPTRTRWSAPLSVECQSDADARLLRTALPAALGTAGAAGTALLLCTR
ncbi:interleukin-3 receptor subunit alpha [Ctenodactylus gundi]